MERYDKILRLKNVDSGYNGATIIQDINFHVYGGEVLLVIGSNGSGKSTLLRAIMGFTRIKKGEISYFGQILNGVHIHDRVKNGISYVFQERRIFNNLTVNDNLKIAFLNNGESLSNSLDNVYTKYPILFEKRYNNAGWLSGGEQQILAIARVLMQKPKIILFDEPSAGVAPKFIDKILSEIKNLASSGIACIIVEHNIKKIIGLVDSIIGLRNGHIGFYKIGIEDRKSILNEISNFLFNIDY